MSETRKLAAILCSDVVGYSRLAGADEDRILARLRALRSDLIDPTIAVHHGRDRQAHRRRLDHRVPQRRRRRALRDRSSERHGRAQRRRARGPPHRLPRSAFTSATSSRRATATSWATASTSPRGSKASPSRARSVCPRTPIGRSRGGSISRSAISAQPSSRTSPSRSMSIRSKSARSRQAQAGRGKPNQRRPPRSRAASLQSLAGDRRRARRRGARGGRLRLAFGSAPRLAGAPVAEDKLATAPRLSIVVLPFENLSGDPEQDYFADGLTDDLTTDLSHLPDSFVIARNTAFTYKGKPVDAKADRARTRRALRARRQRAPRRRKRSPSTPSSSRPRPARMSGPTGSTANAASSANCRSSSSHASPIRSAWSSSRPRLCARCASGRTIQTRSIFPCVDGRTHMAATPPPRQAETTASIFSSARSHSTRNLSRRWSALRMTLCNRVLNLQSDDPKGDIARAEEWAERAVVAEPDNSAAHMAKALVSSPSGNGRRRSPRLRPRSLTIRNNAEAHANARFLEDVSRPQRGRLRGARNRVSSKSARSARPRGSSRFAPPHPFGAMGTGDRMVRQGARGRA